MREFAAVDLGASNGRTIIGRFDGKKIALEELNRFENNYIRAGDAYYWDVLRLYACIAEGLQIYVKNGGRDLAGIGIDTWGLDFGLLDRQGRLAGNPRSYRDPRGERGCRAFHAKFGERAAFDRTGIANLTFNTLYQMYDMANTGDPVLEIADKMLMMPDLLGYLLCGEKTTEYTNATTTQMLGVDGKWSKELIRMAGMPETLFTDLQMSGEVKGELLPLLCEDTGLSGGSKVFCVGSHDTASAVASIPATTENFAFISSGTWSLMGVVSDQAIINDTVFKSRLSNEGTITGKWRPLKNIMGLWIIQNCKRRWDREKSISWEEIVSLARSAPAFRSLIDVNDNLFFDGADMPGKIQRYCRETGQAVPGTKGEIARVVYESLAMSYRETFLDLEALKGGRIDVLHIVGGGAKNTLLNQFTANALGREVIAGPDEATAIGNLMVQVKASGEIKSTDEMRDVIRNSFTVNSFEPAGADEWAEQYERYLKVKKA